MGKHTSVPQGLKSPVGRTDRSHLRPRGEAGGAPGREDHTQHRTKQGCDPNYVSDAMSYFLFSEHQVGLGHAFPSQGHSLEAFQGD